MPPTLVFYISGHGFGHASRDIELIDVLHQHAPDVRIVVRTAAPKWLFDLTLRAPVGWEPLECDTGVAQIDSLNVDVAGTLREAAAFYATFEDRVRREADALRARGATLVAGDIPPLAFAAAHAAGVPSIALGNFSWDWIYDGYEETRAFAPDLVATIRRAYGRAGLALRLPLHAGFAPFERVQDIPFIARRSHRDPGELRARFSLPRDAVLVLPSFGGYGLKDIDIGSLEDLDGFAVLLTSDPAAPRRGHEVGSAGGWARLPRNVFRLPERDLHAAGFRYEDLVAAVDVVVTKPGYGIIADCAANGTAILYTSRGRFPEYEVLVRGMPRYVRSAFLSNEDLAAGRWRTALEALLRQDPVPRPDTSGAEQAGAALMAALAHGRAPAG